MGEDAVLHVEHGHVLMDDALEAGGIEAGEEGGKLRPVEIVAGDHAEEAGVGEKIGGEFVGDVQGVIADERNFRGGFVIKCRGRRGSGSRMESGGNRRSAGGSRARRV